MASISVLAMRNAESGSTDYDLAADAQNVAFDNEHSLKNVFDDHNDSNIDTVKGVHGLRYYNGQLEYWDIGLQEWLLVPVGNAGVNIGDVTGASVTISGGAAAIKWSDPEDIIVEGQTLAAWAGTKIIRKEGSAPLNVNDGILIVDNKTRNQYASSAYVDSGLQANKVYYYRFFPYKMNGSLPVYTKGTSIPISINKTIILNIPTVVGTYTYTGDDQTPTWNNYNENELTLGGDYHGTNVGTYSAIFIPKNGYCWSDGSSAGKPVQWSIDKIKLPIPIVTNTSLTYNRSEQGPTVSEYDSTKLIVTHLKETDVGRYILTFSLKDSTTTVWADDSDTNKEYPWRIDPKVIAIPSLSGTYTYNGSLQTVTNSTIDSNEVTKGGEYSKTDAGEYTVTFNLTSSTNYIWTDGTTEQKESKWTIVKAVGNVILTYKGEPVTSSTVIKLSNTIPREVVNIVSSTGEILASPNNPSIVHSTVENSELIITTSNTLGSTTVIVTSTENENYNSYSTFINVIYEAISLVTWDDSSSDAQITAMIEGYYHGDLTLDQIKSVWNLGDSRIMHIDSVANSLLVSDGVTSHRAQDLKMRIIDFDHDELTTPINGKTKALISLQTSVCLTDAISGENYGDNTNNHYNQEVVYFQPTNTNEGGWKNNTTRLWLNSDFYNVISSTFKSWIKQVKKVNAMGSGSPQLGEITNDYIWLPSEYEMVGRTDYSFVQEGTQYEYYKTELNRAIMPRVVRSSNSFELSAHYWLRSPLGKGNEDYYIGCWLLMPGDLTKETHGTAYTRLQKPHQNGEGYGLAPACCI